MLERLFSNSTLIDQIIVTGERRKYLTALIFPNESAIFKKLKGENLKEGLNSPQVKKLLQLEIKAMSKNLARFEQLKYFEFLPQELSFEEGELTVTLKFKRKIIREKYKKLINNMYS